MWKWERQSVIWIGSVCVQCKRSHSRWIAFAHTPYFTECFMRREMDWNAVDSWLFIVFLFLDIPPHAYTHTTIRGHANIYIQSVVYIYVLKRKLQTSNTLPKMGLYNIYIDIKCATNEHRTHDPKCSVSFLFHELRYIYYWA